MANTNNTNIKTTKTKTKMKTTKIIIGLLVLILVGTIGYLSFNKNEISSPVIVDDNQVGLFFHDENGNDLSLYKEGESEPYKLKDGISVEFPKHYEDDSSSVRIDSKQNPSNNQPGWLDYNAGHDIPDNELIIDLSVGRHGSKTVATDFVNKVFNINDFDGSTNIDVKYSSFMNVKGETKTPKTMNFYYPVTITIDGSEFNLVLGQYGTHEGWGAKLHDAGKAGMESFEAFEAFEEGDWEEGAKEVVEVLKDGVDIFNDENPWIIGFIGTEERPVILLNKDGGTTGMAMISTDGNRMMTVIFKDGKKYLDKDYYFDVTVYQNKKTNK